MQALVIGLLVVWAVSGLALVALILMHSGKGTGVSDMIASSMYSTSGGSSIIEKNLTRVTVACAIVFVLCILIFMLIYPLATVQMG